MPTGITAVIGLGLIGGSVALDLQALGRPLLATDTDPAQRDAAARAGIAVTDDLDETVGDAGLVVVATPPAQVAAVLARVDAVCTGPVVATSVASVQAREVLGLDDLDLRHVRHVGGHPMTGTERSGFHAARRGMFDGSPWIATAGVGDDRGALAAVIDLALTLQAPPVVLQPAAHDRVVALLSHLPHVLAYTAYRRLRVLDQTGTEPLAGRSFRDATRVAATRPAFWSEVLHLNRSAVADLVADVREDLAALETALQDEDPTALETLLTTGHRAVGRARPEVPAPTPLPDGPMDNTTLDELEGHARDGLAISGWTDDGAAVTWTPL